jgi:hypothetical protein
VFRISAASVTDFARVLRAIGARLLMIYRMTVLVVYASRLFHIRNKVEEVLSEI